MSSNIMGAKDIIIMTTKNGRDGKPINKQVKLGDLSKNEICRACANLMNEGQQTKARLDMIQLLYLNHLASLDACKVSYK